MQNPSARVKLFTQVRGPGRRYTHAVSFDYYLWNPSKTSGWVEAKTPGRRPRGPQTPIKPQVQLASVEQGMVWLRREVAKILGCRPSEVVFENTRFYDPDHEV